MSYVITFDIWEVRIMSLCLNVLRHSLSLKARPNAEFSIVKIIGRVAST